MINNVTRTSVDDIRTSGLAAGLTAAMAAELRSLLAVIGGRPACSSRADTCATQRVGERAFSCAWRRGCRLLASRRLDTRRLRAVRRRLRRHRLIEPHRERDAPPLDVDIENADAHDVPWLGDASRVSDEGLRHRRDVNEPILMDTDVDEGPKGSDVGDDALQHHTRLEILELLDTFGESRGFEGRARIAARLLELTQDVGHCQKAELLVDEVLRHQL